MSLPPETKLEGKCGKLAAGGATWLLNTSENAELVRRRGRWLNNRTMEVYIQEISSLQLLHHLMPAAKQKVLVLLDSFEVVVQHAARMQAQSVPANAWYPLFGVV